MEQNTDGLEIFLLKQRLTAALWNILPEHAEWYQDDELWAEEIVESLQNRGFSYVEAETDFGVLVRFSYGRLSELAGAFERPLAIARAVAAILDDPTGATLLNASPELSLSACGV